MNPVFILSIVLLPLTTVQAVTYKKPGDSVVLSPGSEDAPISTIIWKHNSNLATEWSGGDEVVFYGDFKGRCTLNTTTGELTISNLTREDSGNYTAEINDAVFEKTELQIILPVPKPTISINCNDEKTQCVVTCEGNTTDAGRVGYSWRLGDGSELRRTKEITITKEDPGSTISCALGNRVGFQVSDQISNPINPE